MKSCPFCWSSEEYRNLESAGNDVFYVNCRRCGAEGPVGVTSQAAIDLWNLKDRDRDDQHGERDACMIETAKLRLRMENQEKRIMELEKQVMMLTYPLRSFVYKPSNDPRTRHEHAATITAAIERHKVATVQDYNGGLDVDNESFRALEKKTREREPIGCPGENGRFCYSCKEASYGPGCIVGGMCWPYAGNPNSCPEGTMTATMERIRATYPATQAIAAMQSVVDVQWKNSNASPVADLAEVAAKINAMGTPLGSDRIAAQMGGHCQRCQLPFQGYEAFQTPAGAICGPCHDTVASSKPKGH